MTRPLLSLSGAQAEERRGPLIAIVPAEWTKAESPLSASERLVYCVLCRWAYRRTGECFPSVRTIASCCKLSLRTVRASLANLERYGAIEIRRRARKRGRLTSIYRIVGYRELLDRGSGGGSNQHPPVVQIGTQGGCQHASVAGQSSSPNSVVNSSLNRADAPHDCNCRPIRQVHPRTGKHYLEHQPDCPRSTARPPATRGSAA